MSYGTVRRAREASDGRDMANQFLEWLWRVLAAVCVLLEREREEGEGICFCVDREGRGQLLLQVQIGARGWSMEMNGLLFKLE